MDGWMDGIKSPCHVVREEGNPGRWGVGGI